MSEAYVEELNRLAAIERPRAARRSASIARFTKSMFLLLCLEVLFSVPYRTIYLATHSAPKSWFAGLVGLLFCAVALRRRPLGSFANRLMQSPPSWSKSPLAALCAGLFLRLLWIVPFHPSLASDGAGYFTEAIALAQRRTYEGTYWPPGFPLFLSPFVAAFGGHLWVAIFCGFLLFTALLSLVYGLTLEITGSKSTAALGSWLIAIWPGYIAVVGINFKEALIACLLVLTMLLLYRSSKQHGVRPWIMVLGVGVLVGCCALCQPGFTLFPAIIFLSDWLRTRRLLWSTLRAAVTACAMLITILPWTYHNYRENHRFILISSNGGSVFYTANNAHANASYSEESQKELPKDPIAADKEGYRLGKQWVRQHPLDFAILGIRKQVVFLGDDGEGVYEVMHRHQPVGSELIYDLLKGVTSLYWWALWVVLLCCCHAFARTSQWLTWFSLAVLPFAYQWAIDSIFESGSRHHMAYVGFLAAFAAGSLAMNAGASASKRLSSYRMPSLI